MRNVGWILLGLALAGTQSVRADIISQANLPVGTALAGACAGSQVFGSGANPGSVYCTSSDQYVNALEVVSGLGGTAAASVDSSSPALTGNSAFTSSASAIATVGDIKLFATSTESALCAIRRRRSQWRLERHSDHIQSEPRSQRNTRHL